MSQHIGFWYLLHCGAAKAQVSPAQCNCVDSPELFAACIHTEWMLINEMAWQYAKNF